ncbi:MAG: hypothetical protein NT069_31305, partial [Planctomycetota bacterium]|nr:hypothetical protein [Planctomycetota bacterium]
CSLSLLPVTIVFGELPTPQCSGANRWNSSKSRPTEDALEFMERSGNPSKPIWTCQRYPLTETNPAAPELTELVPTSDILPTS